jgi:hypothetical protein
MAMEKTAILLNLSKTGGSNSTAPAVQSHGWSGTTFAAGGDRT